MKSVLVPAAAAALLCGAAAAQAPPIDADALLQDPNALMRFVLTGGRLQGDELERAVAAAAAHPLGGAGNPVRAHLPAGSRAYLARLRCSDGEAPLAMRVGNLGRGVFGSVVDAYELTCVSGAPAKSTVLIDMYHSDHRETAAPPGFTLAAE